ncbi:uncharacterized protein LOC108139385 [Drosophila elegans]|uniref:uncharacterized protein LOC108139385 n=1 Tax=Drosophila elegans TaxID=30023 RepID=UPI0007E7D997|nr:uncharacterized protein LOC108139385 [Drosophila elegans]XP_017117597.1 uncharacterized protein LOC108139385 [Drosophila elegans]
MAFVARRSSDGSVVDRQQVSGRHTLRPLSSSDISDEEAESVLGYTNRTHGAPTVRFVGQSEGETDFHGDVEPEQETRDADVDIPYEDSLENRIDLSGSETDSITSFCNQLDEEEANDALHSDMFNFADRDPEDLDDVDPEEVDHMSRMRKADDAAATDTETVMNFEEDVQSLSSFDSCTPTVTQRAEELDNLDSLSGRTFFKPDTRSLDNISGKTFFKPDQSDGLSGRTFHKQAAAASKDLGGESDHSQLSSRTYDRSQRLHDGSSMSTCSWSAMYGGALQPADGGGGNVVPSLSLNSGASDTSTFYKGLEESKGHQGQAAFEDWKARKAAQKQKSLLAAKLEREKREAEAAQRQRLAQERFQEWCRSKEQQQQQLRKKASSQSSSGSSSSGSSSMSGSGFGSTMCGSRSSAGPMRKVPPEVTNSRIKEWQRSKKKQQQGERERLRRLEENKQKLEEERKKRSEGAWKNWMKQVDKRAKPVPLNQGFDTLRGTISNIYINPVQWVSNIDPQESRRSL